MMQVTRIWIKTLKETFGQFIIDLSPSKSDIWTQDTNPIESTIHCNPHWSSIAISTLAALSLRVKGITDLPSNRGRRTAVSSASQRHVCSLSNHNVCRCVRVIDIWWNFLHWSHRARGWKLHFLTWFKVSELSQNVQSSARIDEEEKLIYMLTDNMQIPELGFGLNSVYLTHVSTLVLLLHVRNVQEPGFVLIVLVMCHWDARIPRNYMIMHSQYSRLLEVHPRHLQWSRMREILVELPFVKLQVERFKRLRLEEATRQQN